MKLFGPKLPGAAALLFTLAFLAAIPKLVFATPLATQVAVELKLKANHAHDANARELQAFSDSIIDLLQLTNGTCPADCPLCSCTNLTSESPEMVECMLSSSIRACETNTFEKCYADLIPGGFDVEGLCDVECANRAVDAPPDTTCRMCEIFACCRDCPAGRAGECFPTDMDDGYTPAGWKPADCSASGGVGVLHGAGLALAVSYALLSLF